MGISTSHVPIHWYRSCVAVYLYSTQSNWKRQANISIDVSGMFSQHHRMFLIYRCRFISLSCCAPSVWSYLAVCIECSNHISKRPVCVQQCTQQLCPACSNHCFPIYMLIQGASKHLISVHSIHGSYRLYGLYIMVARIVTHIRSWLATRSTSDSLATQCAIFTVQLHIVRSVG